MDNNARQINILLHNLVVVRAHIYTIGGYAANMGTPENDRKERLKATPNGRSPLKRLAIRPYLACALFSVAFSHFRYRFGTGVAHIQAFVPTPELVE